jgi:uncharacterized surface protein with fasciclin (FAS1) repeats
MTPQELQYSTTLTTLNTRRVPVSMGGNDIYVDGARITGSSIDTGNVVIYPINNVMVPPYLT